MGRFFLDPIQHIFYCGDQQGIFSISICIEGGEGEGFGFCEGVLQGEVFLWDAEGVAAAMEAGAEVFLFGLAGGGDKDGFFVQAGELHDGGVAGAGEDEGCCCEEGGEICRREMIKDTCVGNRGWGACVGGEAADKGDQVGLGLTGVARVVRGCL